MTINHSKVIYKISFIKRGMEDSETQRRHMLSESSMASESENAVMGQ